MPETTPSTRPAEAYSPVSASPGAGESVRDDRTPAMARAAPPGAASHLLLEGQQLLQESRVAEAEPLLIKALELYEQENEVPAECVQVLSDLASMEITRGDLAAAESLLQRALVLANARLGGDHPHVAAMLGGLARLYLRRSEFAKAEPLLQRLLEIKRVRGDEHPEVATVLASLATVHAAMGAHASSERILRRVLAIREKALAPNHFATVTTLEHLAEACAARGKLDEALTLLRRALTMRERTLGGSHPSIVAARTRIADLELLSSNEDFESETTSVAVMGSLPTFDARVGGPVVSEPPRAHEAVEVVAPIPRDVRASLEDEWVDENEWADPVDTMRPRHWLVDQLSAKAGLVTAFARTPRGRLTVLAVGVVSLLAALLLAIRTRADVAVTRADASTLSLQSGSSAAPRPDASVTNTSASIAPQTPRRVTTSAEVTRRSTARAEVPEGVVTQRSDPITLPNKPKVRAFDVPIDRSPNAPARAPVVTATDFTPSPASLREQSTPSSAAAWSRQPTVHAVLTADNPAPVYPRDLLGRRIEGRVVAEFVVNERGRVDTRTLRIISSTHESFSEAVRDVLPSLRFTPAETDGVRTEELVEMPFRFAAKPE